MIKTIYRSIRNKYLKLKHSRDRVRFLRDSRIDSKCIFEGYNSVGESAILANSSLGLGSFVGRNTVLSSVKVGRFSSIGSSVTNTDGNHPISVFVSTHPAFFSKGKAAGFTFSKEQKFQELRYIDDTYLASIGNDVWIGDNVTILDGVTIGDGAVIGANSLVTRDVEAYTVNYGTPSRKRRLRFSEDVIQELLGFKWWDKDLNWLKSNSDSFDTIDSFRKCMSK